MATGEKMNVRVYAVLKLLLIVFNYSQVRAGCLEAILGLAIYAQQHTAVWDSAALLLRDHPAELSSHRQRSLLENMVAASVQMDPTER